MSITQNDDYKIRKSDSYKYVFNKKTGLFIRMGKDQYDDPTFSPFGPEILDIEISTNGCPNNCPFCYKDNNSGPATNMSFDSFKIILDKMSDNLVQVAFGITGVQTNPDFIRMMEYTRSCGIIPNFTLSGIDLTPEIAKRCSEVVGALAVSCYSSDKNVCYNTVKTFTDLGLSQTNIHLMVSEETMDFVYEVLSDRMSDPRLANMGAIVFLGVKPKGRAAGAFTPSNYEDYGALIKYCTDHNLSIGFDSCSAPKYEFAVSKMDIPDDEKRNLVMYSESCESGRFSFYINVNGVGSMCSFAEDHTDLPTFNILNCANFVDDVWLHPDMVSWRNKLIQNTNTNGCIECPIYDLS